MYIVHSECGLIWCFINRPQLWGLASFEPREVARNISWIGLQFLKIECDQWTYLYMSCVYIQEERANVWLIRHRICKHTSPPISHTRCRTYMAEIILEWFFPWTLSLFQLWWLIMSTFWIATLVSIDCPGQSCLRAELQKVNHFTQTKMRKFVLATKCVKPSLCAHSLWHKSI